MQEQHTLERTFGERVGRFFQGVLEEHGVQVHGGQELERFEGDGERVRRSSPAAASSSTATSS